MTSSFLGLMSRYRWRFIAVPSHRLGLFALGHLERVADETSRIFLVYVGHKFQV